MIGTIWENRKSPECQFRVMNVSVQWGTPTCLMIHVNAMYSGSYSKKLQAEQFFQQYKLAEQVVDATSLEPFWAMFHSHTGSQILQLKQRVRELEAAASVTVDEELCEVEFV